MCQVPLCSLFPSRIVMTRREIDKKSDLTSPPFVRHGMKTSCKCRRHSCSQRCVHRPRKDLPLLQPAQKESKRKY